MSLFGACVICEQEKEGKNTEERATHRSKEKAKKESILISLTFSSICFHLSDIFYIVATFIASKINYIVANISKKGDSKHGSVTKAPHKLNWLEPAHKQAYQAKLKLLINWLESL